MSSNTFFCVWILLSLLCFYNSHFTTGFKTTVCDYNETYGYFWHVTDMHWDPTYSDGERGWSCNDMSKPPDGAFGDFQCDAPYKLIKSAIEAMKDICPDPDFLIWTGDDTPHIWNDTILNPDVVLEIIYNQTSILKDTFPEHIVYSALGNHDWSPKSQLPPNAHPMYDTIADYWSDWLGTAEANKTFRQGAFYKLSILGTNLTAIILNTNLYYNSNDLTGDLDDPANQFQWLDDELTGAAERGERVILIGHVPPGMFEKHVSYYWYYPQFNDRFLGLLKKHRDVIGSAHFAHHHTDTIRVLYEEDTPVSSIFLAPAVAPWETTLDGVMGGRGNNPGIRLLKYHKTTGVILDVYQYYLNLTKANTNGQDDWELEYQATEYYSKPDMGTESLHSLVQSLMTDEVFTKYYQANGVLYDPDEQWDMQIRVVHYCAASELYYNGYSDCYDHYMGTGHGISIHTKYPYKYFWLCVFVLTVSQLHAYH